VRPFSENALRVLQARYLKRDSNRRIIETPQELFQRVARAAASPEAQWGGASQVKRWEEEFHRMLSSLDFLPNSPMLMNAGLAGGQLSACFVLPVEDTMEGIFEAVKQMALVQRTGGGTGFSFSRLRPKGDVVESTGGEASGPVSFMRIFDSATENIKQGGKRRGANMGVLRVDHPDILEFIRVKMDGRSMQNFNLSVGVTDGFMEAVRQRESYSLIHPRTAKPAGTLKAGEVFEEITQAAWATGDPGLLFLDAINRANPTPSLGAIEASNPCGELPLLPFESCNLGSLNLARFLREEQGRADVDWDRLRLETRNAVRFLDNMIEQSAAPIPQVRERTLSTRKIGLGVMGFAELLIRLGISYDSPEAIQIAERIMQTINEEALYASRALAEERGVFPVWSHSSYQPRNLRLRNAVRTAVAPTGTISIIAQTSAGIEPIFALAYRRTHVLKDETLAEVNPLFLEELERRRLDKDRLIARVLEQGSLKKVPEVPEEIRRLFVTALEIPPEQHLKIQHAFQKHVDSSVSKTVNLPQESTPQEIARIYQQAWELGLKGITIYRYRSKPTQVLELGAGEVPLQMEYTPRCDPEECRL
jgi:ribonucleoside-diphosphate reductase alpha chain